MIPIHYMRALNKWRWELSDEGTYIKKYFAWDIQIKHLETDEWQSIPVIDVEETNENKNEKFQRPKSAD